MTATDSAPPPPLSQYAAKASPYPPVKAWKGSVVGVLEILKPAFEGTVHILDDGIETMTVASPGFLTNRIFDFRKTLLAWPSGVPSEAISQKIKHRFGLRQINGLRLFGMQSQSSFFNQFADQSQCGLDLGMAPAKNHKIICVPDHPISRLGHRNINRVEEEVGKQRTDDSPLRCTAFRSPSIHFIKDVYFEKCLQQLKHSPIRNVFADLIHEQIVRDAVKVGPDVRIHYMDAPGLKELLDLSKGILAPALRSKPVAPRYKFPLEDWFYGHTQGRLHHSIPHCGGIPSGLLSLLPGLSIYTRRIFLGR